MLEPITTEELARYPAFRLLDPHTAERIRGVLRPAVYSNGAAIIREGEDGDALYIIRRGEVEVLKRLPTGEEDLLAVLPETSLFGEIDFLLGRKRTATVRARGQVELLVLPRPAFYELLMKRHLGPYQIIHYLAIVLAERLQETNKRLEHLLASRDDRGQVESQAVDRLLNTWKGGFSFLDKLDLQKEDFLGDLLEESLPGTPVEGFDPSGEF